MTPTAAGKIQATLGSLILGSVDPDRLDAWYRAAFAPDAEPGNVLALGTGSIVFDRREDIGAAPAEPERILINLHVENIRTVAAHLDTLAVRWIRPVSDMPFGFLATLADPDGNYVQIIEFSHGTVEATVDGEQQGGEG
jgi:predicted enzyme related to lactoylglutathione lyase